MLAAPPQPACPGKASVDIERDHSRARLAEALLRTANEDQAGFRTLYLLTRHKLFRICARICDDRSAAEDVLAEVYLTIWKRAGAWDPARGSALTWLAAIARNRAIDWRRAHAVTTCELTNQLYDVPDDAPDGEMRLLTAESAAQIQRCLQVLKPAAQSAIRSAFFDGLTYPELAARHAIPLGTVKSMMRRSFVRIRLELERDDKDALPAVATTAALAPRLLSSGFNYTVHV